MNYCVCHEWFSVVLRKGKKRSKQHIFYENGVTTIICYTFLLNRVTRNIVWISMKQNLYYLQQLFVIFINYYRKIKYDYTIFDRINPETRDIQIDVRYCLHNLQLQNWTALSKLFANRVQFPILDIPIATEPTGI